MVDIYKKPLIISGPCSAETREQTINSCVGIAECGKVNIIRAGVWKPRTKPGSFEGAGEEALKWLGEVKTLTSLPIAVEVGNANHVELALSYGIDMLWIGARTTVNPFLVQEIADSVKGCNIPIMIKNPISPDLGLWIGAVERFRNVGIEDIGAIHRGFTIYDTNIYRNAPMWHIPLEFKRIMPEIPLICDPSHIGGTRDLLYLIAQKSADLNYNGLIIESHICPEKALSDSEQQISVDLLCSLLDKIVWREPKIENIEYLNTIEQLRCQIDTIDDDILSLISKRMNISDKIGKVKSNNNVSILQSERWDGIVKDRLSKAANMGLSYDFVKSIMETVHVESINRQNDVMNK